MCHVLKIRDQSEVMNVIEYAEDFYLQGRSFYDINKEDLMTMYQVNLGAMGHCRYGVFNFLL